MLIKTETRVLEIGLSIWNGFPGVDCFDDIGGQDARDGHDVFELDDTGCSPAYIYTDPELKAQLQAAAEADSRSASNYLERRCRP